MLKSLLCTFFGMICLAGSLKAQLNNTYSFSYFSGTFTPVSGGTTITYTDGGFGFPSDEGYAPGIPIGFTFNYNGVNYTDLTVSTNCFVAFGAFTGTSYTNNISTGPTAAGRPILAAVWDDMDNAGPTTYITSGSAPNRVFTVQWTNVWWNWSAVDPAISVQIKLYETKNVIEFVYRQEIGLVSDPAGQGDLGASIGITAAATGSGNYMSLNNAGTSPVASTTVATNTIITKPATGQVYQWIPYCSTSTNNHSGTELISRVQFGTIDNSSTSTAQYENFTNLSTFVQPSTANPITVTLAGSYFGDTTLVWIDFNHNGSFADPGELVFNGSGAGPFTGNITIPALSANVLLGPTRMRVKLDDTGGSPSNTTACGLSDWGQVEDYTVNIQNCIAGTVTTQPANTPICNGGNGSITVAATGSSLVYQWQVSTNGGTSYSNLTNVAPYSGVTTNTLVITGATPAINGYLYHVLVSGSCTPVITSAAAILSINTPAAITTNPTNQTACAGNTANMSVVASGSGPTYQWQVSTDGGSTYNNISGATSATLSLTGVTTSMDLNRYRAVVTVASCGSVTSAAALLNVKALPVVTLVAAPVTQILPGVTSTLTVTSVPAAQTSNSYSWTLNGSPISGATTSSLVADVNGLTGLGTYKATVTDVNGCVNSSGNVVITAKPSDKLFIYPNPSTNGQFQLRLYSQALNDERTVTVYNSQGDVVITKTISVANSYVQLSFDLRGAAAGVYMIHVTHRYINRELVGKLIIK